MQYNEITEQLRVDKIIKLLYKLGAQSVIEKEGHLITNTICHNIHGGSMKLYYYYDTHLFYCYTGCSKAMSIFSFLKQYYELRRFDYNWYNDIYLVALGCCDNIFGEQLEGFEPIDFLDLRSRYRERGKVGKLQPYSTGVLDCFEPHHYTVEWLDDGISKETMDKYNIRYSISQNKIIIPHYDIEGRLVGIRGRTLNSDEAELYGKYMPIMVENKIYSHRLSLNLYGLCENKENMKRSRIVYIMESEKSVLQAESFKIPNCCAAICGSNFNKYQMRLLLKHIKPMEVVLCLDNEELPDEDRYFNKLYSICERYNKYTQMSFIYDRQKLTDRKDSPTDKGEEVFLELLRRRVKVK